MNPSSYTDSLETPLMNATLHCRLQDGADEIMDSMKAETSSHLFQQSQRGDGQLELCCKRPGVPPASTSPIKEMHMNTPKDTSSHTDNADSSVNSLKNILHQSRRLSWTQKTEKKTFEGSTTPLSLESATRHRFARRNSYVSDMVVARTRATQVISKALEESRTTSSGETNAALGYGEEEPQQKRQTPSPAPPAKRRRYQRRNSFVVPETSRAPGQTTSSFSWKAMDFLYGRGGENAAAARGGENAAAANSESSSQVALAD